MHDRTNICYLIWSADKFLSCQRSTNNYEFSSADVEILKKLKQRKGNYFD